MAIRIPTEQETMKQGLSLLRRCWLPILLAGVLCILPAVGASIVEHIGLEKVDAATAHLRPVFPENLDDYAAYLGAKNLYTAAVKEAYTPYSYLIYAILLLNLVIEPVVLLGLNRGLLRCMKGGTCSLRDVFGGLRGGRRAIGVGLLVMLITVGVNVAGQLAASALEAILDPLMFGSVLVLSAFALVMAVIAFWFDYRYLLAPLHCADEAHTDLSAADCLRYAHQDQQQYGLLSMLFTLWPVWLVGIVHFLLKECCTGSWLVPVSHLLNLAAMMLETAIVVAMYGRLHLVQDDGTPDEGLARAMALARETE